MNSECDALRLRMAVDAYRAAQPTDAEVERGVRKALSAMRRSQFKRRATLTPAIIVAFLAFGTLAYANPNKLVRWVSSLVRGSDESAAVVRSAPARAGAMKAEAPAAVDVPSALAPRALDAAGLKREPQPATSAPEQGDAPAAAKETPGAAAGAALKSKAAPSTRQARPRPRATWAEVNEALAAQDTRRALVALKSLARHGDAATRAKAELGIAQLNLARGDRRSACASAKALLSRQDVPRRVQERATALLESCSR